MSDINLLTAAAQQEEIISATTKLSQLIHQRQSNVQQPEISLQIQGENGHRKKKASSTTRGIKVEFKNLKQHPSNAYQNYLHELYQISLRNEDNDSISRIYSIKGNARVITDLNKDNLSTTRNHRQKDLPLYIPKVSQAYQNESLTMTPVVNRSQNNNITNITPEATTVSGPLKQTFDAEPAQKKIVGTIFERPSKFSFENSLSRLPVYPASSLDHYNQNFQDTMTQNHSQLDDSVIPFYNNSQNQSTIKRINKRISLMPLTNEHLKSANKINHATNNLKQLPLLTERSISGGPAIRIQRGDKKVGSSRNSVLLTGNAGYDEMMQYQARTQNDSKANRQLLKSYKDNMMEVRQQSLKFNHLADNRFEEENQNEGADQQEASIDQIQPLPISSLLNNKMYTQKLQIRKLKLISQKIDTKEIEIEQKLTQSQQEKKWSYDDQMQQSKEEIGIYTEALISLIGFLQNNCLPYDEEVASILSRAVKGIQSQQASQEKGFTLVITDYSKEVEKLKQDVLQLEKNVEDLKSQLLEESKMFNDENKAYLEKRVRDFLNQAPQKLLVEPIITGETDETTERARHLTQYEIRDQLIHVFEKLQYSGAKDDLDHIFTILNFYQGVKKEILYENKRINEKEDAMSNNAFIFQGLKEDFGDTLKLTQTETARKVLQRYYKNITTRDLHVQTMPEESYIRELEMIISDKDDMIKATNQTLSKMLAENQVFQAKITSESNRCEQLSHLLKGKTNQLEELQDRYDALEKERAELNEKNVELDQARQDMKKQVETLREERTKVKLQMIMQKNQMIREIEGLNQQISTLKEAEATSQLNSALLIRSSHHTNISGVDKGERSVIDENEYNSQSRSSRIGERVHHSQDSQGSPMQSVNNITQSKDTGSQQRNESKNEKRRETIAPSIIMTKKDQQIKKTTKETPIQIQEEQYNSPDIAASPDIKLKPQYNSNEKQKQSNENSSNRIAIALQNAKSSVESGIAKNNISKIAQSREKSQENVRKAYGNVSTNNGTPQMTRINAKVNIDLSQSPYKQQLINQPLPSIKTEDQGTQNSIMRSSSAEMITIQLSDTATSHPMLHIYQKPIVTLKKYKNDLLLTNHLIKEFISNQRGSVSLNRESFGIDTSTQTEQIPNRVRGQIKHSRSPKDATLKPPTQTIQTQTRLVGDVKLVQPVQNCDIQCEAWDIDREVEREMLQIENIEKLYGGKQKLIHTYLSRQNQQYSPTIRRAVGGGVREGSFENSLVLGGSLDRQKYKFFDNKEHFRSQRLRL